MQDKNKSLAESKIDELLSTRLNLKQNLDRINRLIKQGFDTIQAFPHRWYVTCKNRDEMKPVLEYLKSQGFNATFYDGCGVGLLDGQPLFIPEDCNFDDFREISIEEFNQILALIKS